METAFSILTTAAVARSLVATTFPGRLHISGASHHTILIHQSDSKAPHNQLFLSCEIYLSSIISSTAARFHASKHRDSPSITLSLLYGQQLLDVFGGIDFSWRLLRRKSVKSLDYFNGRRSKAHLELCFHKKHTNAAVSPYLRHIIDQAERLRAADRTLKLHTNCNTWWLSPPTELHHPATFETIAMETDLKQRVMEHLSRFAQSSDVYRRVGAPRKQSYLIYGPSGTGKTSLVAAIAKYLHLDIYDLNVKEVCFNNEFKTLLLETSNRCMLVVEDVDSLGESGKDDEFTIAGLLRFMEALWTRTDEERVVVFTAREKGRVDPILLEPGGVDMMVPMGFCGASALRVMVRNYLGVEEHWRLGEIEGLLTEEEVTPAEVGEELMRSEDVDVALDGLVEFLRRKRRGYGSNQQPGRGFGAVAG